MSFVFIAAALGLVLLAAFAFLVVYAFRTLRERAEHTGVAVLALCFTGCMIALAGMLSWHDGNEPLNFVTALVGTVAKFDLVQYPHPALYFNVSSCLYALYVVASSLFGGVPLDDALARTLLERHADLLIISRVLSALSAGALLGVVYASIVTLTRNTAAALVALAALALLDTWRPTEFSSYSFSALLAFAFLYAAIFHRHTESLSWRGVVLCGVLAGAAFSANYLAALFAPAFLVAVLARPQRRRFLALLLFAGVFVAVFLVTNPRIFVNAQDYLTTLLYRVQEVSEFDPRNTTAGAARDFSAEPLFYLEYLADKPLAWLAALGLVGTSLRFRESGDVRLAFVAFFPAYLLLVLSVVATKYDRYLVYLYPMLAILAGAGLAEILRALRRLESGALVVLAVALAFLWGPFPSLLMVVYAAAFDLTGQRPLAVLVAALFFAGGTWTVEGPPRGQFLALFVHAALYWTLVRKDARAGLLDGVFAGALLGAAAAIDVRAAVFAPALLLLPAVRGAAFVKPLLGVLAGAAAGYGAVFARSGVFHSFADLIGFVLGRLDELTYFDARVLGGRIEPLRFVELTGVPFLVVAGAAGAGALVLLWRARSGRRAWALVAAAGCVAAYWSLAGHPGVARLVASPALAVLTFASLAPLFARLAPGARAALAVAAGVLLALPSLVQWGEGRLGLSLRESDPVQFLAHSARYRVPPGSRIGISSLVVSPFEEGFHKQTVPAAFGPHLRTAAERFVGRGIDWTATAVGRAQSSPLLKELSLDYLYLVEWHDLDWAETRLRQSGNVFRPVARSSRVGRIAQGLFKVQR